MAKEKPVTVKGTIISENGNAFFTVQLESGHELQCRVSGSMIKNKIMVHDKDSVLTEICPYDITRGRIIYVYRNK